jgi:hypothetical protein
VWGGFDAREVLEHVRSEGDAVRPHDLVVLVDPDDRRDVADGVDLGQHVVGIDEHRERDVLDPGAHVVR